ncbi:MAG: hypothetical protein MSA37_07895 [Prevotella sp.]|nr:hypothetical protein [Prevotella sp.]
MKKFTIKSLLIAAALCLGTSAWAEDETISLTSIESGASTGSEITKSDAGNNVAYTQYRNWGSSYDGTIKFNAGGSIALYKFDISSLLNKKGVVKNATLSLNVTPNGDCYDVYLLGYNGSWESLSNSRGSIGGTVNDGGSFQPLDDPYQGISIGSSATTISASAKTYLNSALEAGRTEVSFAVAMNLKRTFSAASSATLSVVFTDEVYHNYTINAVCESEIIKEFLTGSTTENSDYSITGIPEFIEKGGKYYQLSDNNVKSRSISYKMGTTDAVQSINYVVNEDVLFFSEVEDNYKTSSTNYKYPTNSKYSGGVAVTGNRTGANITLTFSVPNNGTYELVLAHMDNDDRVNNYYLDNTKTVYEKRTGAADSDGFYRIEEPLTAGEHKLYIAANYNLTAAYDYFYITKVSDVATKNVSVGSNGIATFTPSVALDFTNATNIKAYTATVSETTVTLTETKTVAAGEGVIIKSVNGGEKNETIAVANPATATEGNALVGTLVDIDPLATDATINEVTYTNYILNNGSNGIGFYKANGKKVAAGKAYLRVPAEKVAGAKALTIVWNDGETTGIKDNYEFGIMNSDAVTYDLSGRKVANPAKGLYIKNGKKFIVK